MKRLETAALAVIALSTASVIAIAQTATPNAGSTGGAAASQQLSSADCQKVWDQVNPQAKASISGMELQSRVTDMKKVDANSDSMISSQEFTKACEQGYVKQAAAGTGSSSGASSGTSGSSSSGSSSMSKDAPAGSSSGSSPSPQPSR